jgi:hypothetical protein
MPRAIPPLDHVARALAALGHARSAVELLELIAARGGDEGARGEALLASMRAQREPLAGAPGLRVDVDLVESIATHGRLREALVVARAIDAGGTVLGLEILHALETVLAPISASEPPEMASCWRDGLGGSAIAAQRIVLSPSASAELRQRAQVLVQLLRGFRALSPGHTPAPALSVDPAVAAVVAEMSSRRDLPWGRRALAKVLALPGGRELLESVDLLVQATDGVANEDLPGAGHATAPLQGDGVALLHIRMMNLDQAERTLRRICVEKPEDRLAPQLLSAVGRLRAVQEVSRDEPSGGDASAPRAPPPDWLNKRARRASVEGWAGSAKRGTTPVSYVDEATSVLRPDDEAELHLRAGRPDKAVELYRRLAERFPDRPRFKERADEIQAQMEDRSLMFADEMTVRRDLSGLASAAGVRSQERALDPEPEARHTIEMPMAFDGGLEGAPIDEELTPPTPMTIGAPTSVALASGPSEADRTGVVAVRPIIGIG